MTADLTPRPTRALFIKLGVGGEWEDEALSTATLRFGYREAAHADCLAGDWDKVRAFWMALRRNESVASNDTRQIRDYYTAGPETLFITFARHRLWWCQPEGPVTVGPQDVRLRATRSGWHDTSLGGAPLTTDRLSGKLLKVQMYRGTLCAVHAFDYLLRKLTDEPLPEIARAEAAEAALAAACLPLIRLLTWQDFEALVDLIFAGSGWQRLGVVGRTQKTLDLDLRLPSTGERAFVQIKAQASPRDGAHYAALFRQAASHDRLFLICHSGSFGAIEAPDITVIDPDRLARMVIGAGLTGWLRDKVG